jgi:hypothetical protein
MPDHRTMCWEGVVMPLDNKLGLVRTLLIDVELFDRA